MKTFNSLKKNEDDEIIMIYIFSGRVQNIVPVSFQSYRRKVKVAVYEGCSRR